MFLVEKSQCMPVVTFVLYLLTVCILSNLSFTLTNSKSFTRAFQSQKDENWYVY